MNIYGSLSIAIGICSIIIFWAGLYFWERLISIKPIKRSFIVSIAGILACLIYAIAHMYATYYVFKVSSYDSSTM
ncbi:MAG: hypothetical protein FWD70_08010, partial [Desulfuromonadales bacterium]|nr:hypothetical protein [Desulfuromonadales bacterium]